MIDEITVVGKLHHHETVARGVVSDIRFDYFIDDFSSVDSKRQSGSSEKGEREGEEREKREEG